MGSDAQLKGTPEPFFAQLPNFKDGEPSSKSWLHVHGTFAVNKRSCTMNQRRRSQSPITSLRTGRGWSLFTTGRKSNLHPNTVSMAELGVHSRRTLASLARAFGVEISALIRPEGGEQ